MQPNQLSPGVSIILCCYNSARRLPSTLKHLAKQRAIENIPLEVIVVDNASTDKTNEVAVKEWSNYNGNIRLRVVVEEKKGLSEARRRGIAESNFDTLIFCDDDNWLEENYVSTAFELMKDKSIGALGGIGSAAFETREPSWFRHVTSYYALGGQQNSISRDINNFRYLYGAGLVVSKHAIVALFESGFANATSGRIGKKLIAGEDTEISYALQVRGHKVVYSSDLKFRHFIPNERTKLSYFNRLVIGIGYSSEMMYPYKAMFNPGLRLPFPTMTTLQQTALRVIKCGVVLILPFSRYGPLFTKWKVFLFELGRLKFQVQKQKYFQ